MRRILGSRRRPGSIARPRRARIAREGFEARRTDSMATPQTAVRRMREMCLTLPDSTEAEHFGEACFRVGRRIFASCGGKDGACRLVFELEPAHARRLLASDPRVEPYARQESCVSMDAAGVQDWDEVRALVLESYRLNQSRTRSSRRAGGTRGKKSPKTR